MSSDDADLVLRRSTEHAIYGDGGVHNERVRAHKKHRDHSMESWDAFSPARYLILAEEVGEVAKEFNDAKVEARAIDQDALRKELVQVAAMAVAWIAALDNATTKGQPDAE